MWMKDTFCFVVLAVVTNAHVSFTIRPGMCVEKVNGVDGV